MIDKIKIEKQIESFEAATKIELVVSVHQKAESYLEFSAFYALVFSFLAWLALDLFPNLYFAEALFFLGVVSFYFVPRFAFLFVPRSFLKPRVSLKAKSVFFDEGLSQTDHRAALLLFVSRAERKLEILCDLALQTEEVRQIVEKSVKNFSLELKKKSISEALCSGIQFLEQSFVGAGMVFPQKSKVTLSNRLRDDQE